MKFTLQGNKLVGYTKFILSLGITNTSFLSLNFSVLFFFFFFF